MLSSGVLKRAEPGHSMIGLYINRLPIFPSILYILVHGTYYFSLRLPKAAGILPADGTTLYLHTGDDR